MGQHTFEAIRKPRTDDRPLWDIMCGIWGYPAVLVAHELRLSHSALASCKSLVSNPSVNQP